MTLDSETILPGKPYPRGSTYDGTGTNFAVYSETARGMELCLYDPSGRRQTRRINMTMKTGHVWHVYLRGIRPGQLYGYRARGFYRPQQGTPINASKLLIDPYARALTGRENWQAPLFAYQIGDDGEPGRRETRDNAWGVPKGMVYAESFDWQGDAHPDIPWSETVIYEAHVKGMTQLHPDVPEELRGTYAGIATEPIINHLKSLGVTALELLPVHAHADSHALYKNGLTNYWGYDTLNFFAPEARYASKGDRGGQVAEFKEMVRVLHQNGIEVLLDVVYNHTCEGNHFGPTFSFKGLDNRTYYRLVDDSPRHYVDYTGTGNSINARHPETLKLIMDSLRYWVEEMHVDGFRFDLAVTTGRNGHDFNKQGPFFDALHQDPVLSKVKLIAEPWDIGEGGYQVGNFPSGWSEWNGKYRDAVRSFWRGDDAHAADMAYRLTASSDLYNTEGRSPFASVNFIIAHDGFTLEDLVSYNDKHNEANGEDNQDGTNDNISWNCGEEGETDDSNVIALRERQKRNFLATLLISQGVPMLGGGDELSRTQQGNNNTYCQDNELNWFNWQLDDRRQEFLQFSQRVLEERRKHPALRRRAFFQGRPVRGSDAKDVTWLRTDGQEMIHEEWFTSWVRSFGMMLDGNLNETDARGKPLTDDVLLVLLNAFAEPLDFTLPATKMGDRWQIVLDTARPDVAADAESFAATEAYTLESRSLVLLRCANS